MLIGLKSNEYSSIYSAAKSFGISKTTLRRRVEGTRSRATAHISEQNLSDSEENAFIKWITTLTKGGIPPSYPIIRELAETISTNRVASINNSSIECIHYPPLGKLWVYRFVKRHP